MAASSRRMEMRNWGITIVNLGCRSTWIWRREVMKVNKRGIRVEAWELVVLGAICFFAGMLFRTYMM
jgi:hypothetical protein